MGGPTNAERGLPGVQLDDPAFLAWAEKQGKRINRSTPTSEFRELLAQYEHELGEQRRREDESIQRSLQQEEILDDLTKDESNQPLVQRQAAEDEDQRLRKKIEVGWRSGSFSSSLKSEAETAVNNQVPLRSWLYGSHGADRDEDRWYYMRYYLDAYYKFGGAKPPSEEQLLDVVVHQEKIYLTEMRRRADELAKAERPALQLEALRAWAKKQVRQKNLWVSCGSGSLPSV